MWARISELVLGIWLIISYPLFENLPKTVLVVASFIILLGAFSYFHPLRKVHLIQILNAGLLFYLGRAPASPWISIGLQNCILMALVLLIFAIIPSKAQEAPDAWKRFLKNRSKSIHSKVQSQDLHDNDLK